MPDHVLPSGQYRTVQAEPLCIASTQRICQESPAHRYRRVLLTITYHREPHWQYWSISATICCQSIASSESIVSSRTGCACSLLDYRGGSNFSSTPRCSRHLPPRPRPRSRTPHPHQLLPLRLRTPSVFSAAHRESVTPPPARPDLARDRRKRGPQTYLSLAHDWGQRRARRPAWSHNDTCETHPVRRCATLVSAARALLVLVRNVPAPPTVFPGFSQDRAPSDARFLRRRSRLPMPRRPPGPRAACETRVTRSTSLQIISTWLRRTRIPPSRNAKPADQHPAANGTPHASTPERRRLFASSSPSSRASRIVSCQRARPPRPGSRRRSTGTSRKRHIPRLALPGARSRWRHAELDVRRGR